MKKRTTALMVIAGLSVTTGAITNHTVKEHKQLEQTKQDKVLLSGPSTESPINMQILNKIQYPSNRVKYFKEATDYHGSQLDDCVYWMSSMLRSLGYNIPDGMGYTGSFSEWLLAHGWTNHKGIEGIKPGDICFAGFTHTFVFVSWYNKAEGLANVCDNQIAYFNPDKATYVRHLYGAKTPVEMPGGMSTYFRTTNYLTPPQFNNNFVQVDTGNDINLCTTISGSVINTIPNNTRLKVVSSRDGWYYVNYNGELGWVAGWLVKKI